MLLNIIYQAPGGIPARDYISHSCCCFANIAHRTHTYMHVHTHTTYTSHTHTHTHTELTISPPPLLSTALDEEFPPTITKDDCFCPDVGAVSPDGSSNNVLIGVLAFFIVLLLIVIIALAVVGVLFFLCYRRMKEYSTKKTHNFDSGDGGRFSEERDITKTPTFSCESPSRKASVARCVYLWECVFVAKDWLITVCKLCTFMCRVGDSSISVAVTVDKHSC